MSEEYTSLGLMSGTSGDGVDASIIKSDGETKYKVIKDKYFQYDKSIHENIHDLKEKIHSISILEKIIKELSELERQITLFHAKVIQEISEHSEINIIGFHGQTIYHNSKEKISKQLGDGKLLSQLTRKIVVNNFRQNDILNGGEGAPLTPIFHQLIAAQNKLALPLGILNIGGISNITIIDDVTKSSGIVSRDIGPGNCLIDSWVRKNSNKIFDIDGLLASSGSVNKIILEQGQELFSNRTNQNILSFDVNDFDVSFVRGLSLEDGAATLTDFTARIIGTTISSLMIKVNKPCKVMICGGGRKNKTLINAIKSYTEKNISFEPIDMYGVNGDFVESQAFAFIAIRSKLGLPISFPNTTGCNKPTTGGKIIEIK